MGMGTFGMDGQMRDTRMSDSPSTAVAMRVNSQHQSDKLPDKVVRAWRCHDGGHDKQTLGRGLTKPTRHFWPVEMYTQFYSPRNASTNLP